MVANDESNTVAEVVISGTKKGVGSFTKTLSCSEFKWNIFGKNIDTVIAGSSKKVLSLDSEIFFKAADEDGTTEVCGVLFGTVKAQSTGGCSPCGDPAGIKYTPVKFVGKYVGFAPATGCACATELTYELGEGSCSNSNCLQFVEPTDDKLEYFCGDIVLKYNAKKSGYR